MSTYRILCKINLEQMMHERIKKVLPDGLEITFYTERQKANRNCDLPVVQQCDMYAYIHPPGYHMSGSKRCDLGFKQLDREYFEVWIEITGVANDRCEYLTDLLKSLSTISANKSSV